MKRLLIMMGLVALLAGCESTDNPIERVRQQVTGDYPTQFRTFGADEKTTFNAAKVSLKGIGFHFTHGGQAQGIMHAASEIEPGDKFGTLHQFNLKASFQTGLDGKSCDVTVSLTETIADDVNGKLGTGSEAPLRDTALYQVFFRGIEQAINPAVSK
jgi:predicted nucleic acid-binding Zn ribbon protein